MIRRHITAWGLAGVLLSGGFLVDALAAQADTPATAPSARLDPSTSTSQSPASQPAENIVLVRLGPKTITQAEFNSLFHSGPALSFESNKDLIMLRLVERKWLEMYLDQHPDLVSEEAVQAYTDRYKTREKLKTDEEFNAWLEKAGRSRKDWDLHWKLVLGSSALSEKGRQRGRDEETLKRMFEARPEAFNGTEVVARHIMIGFTPYDPPEEKQAKREKIEKIRAGLVNGELPWSEAVKESTDQTRSTGGMLPNFTRYNRMMEPVAAAAFDLKIGELSEVIETTLGFHVLEVIRRIEGKRNFEESKREIKNWLEREPYIMAIDQMRKKYPPVGVQPPRDPGPRPAPATRPGEMPATRAVP